MLLVIAEAEALRIGSTDRTASELAEMVVEKVTPFAKGSKTTFALTIFTLNNREWGAGKCSSVANFVRVPS